MKITVKYAIRNDGCSSKVYKQKNFEIDNTLVKDDHFKAPGAYSVDKVLNELRKLLPDKSEIISFYERK